MYLDFKVIKEIEKQSYYKALHDTIFNLYSYSLHIKEYKINDVCIDFNYFLLYSQLLLKQEQNKHIKNKRLIKELRSKEDKK